jgi:SPP1 family predicted phage head-tail adaptor
MLATRTNIGALDRKITFQQKLVSTNQSNEDQEDGWIDIDTTPTVYATMTEYRGSEQFVADKINAFQTSLFIIRYRSDINVMMRILCDGLAYNIHSIEWIGRKRYLRIAAEVGFQFEENNS